MDLERTKRFVDQTWDESVMPALMDFIRIPALSPGFDDAWEKNGHLDGAIALGEKWAKSQGIPGLRCEVFRAGGRTPLLYIEIPGQTDQTVLMYGHLDKQPEADGWDEGLGPWTPVVRDGKLYGRGGADDGYALFSSLTAVRALAEQGLPHARCVALIEACEESGSDDLPYYIDKLRERIGSPALVTCLDSGCGNYDQLWLTSSLRGLVSGTLSVSILSEGVHSGDASGIVPSTFRIVRMLLDRLEDSRSGRVLPAALHVELPPDRREQASVTARSLGGSIEEAFPFLDGASAVSRDPLELLLARTWQPQLEITGAAGMPPIETAGNVLRPATSVKLSLRLPPTAEPDTAAAVVKDLLEKDPPYGARVQFELEQGAAGWNAPESPAWFDASVEEASQAFFGREVCYYGEGGSIPLMAMLGDMFPEAKFLITGVLGPKSNAHGPNEFLHLSTVKNLTACVAKVLADQARSAGAAR